MSTDPRGVKRGNCLVENCDCSSYEYEEKNGAKCNYCFCPPTKHLKIEDVSVKKMSENCHHIEVIDSSFEKVPLSSRRPEEHASVVSYIYVPSTSTICSSQVPVSSRHPEEHASVASYNNVPASTICSPQVPLSRRPEEHASVASYNYVPASTISSPQFQDLLPKKLPKQVEIALKNKSLTPALRNRIVRVIADKCFEEGIPSRCVDTVADLAVQKWSPLKARYGESSAGSLATQIKRRMAKLRLHSKRSEQDWKKDAEINEVTSYNHEQMAQEMSKQNPSILKLKQFLDSTRDHRKAEVKRLSALEIMNLYPALKMPDLLLWEFTRQINVPENVLIHRWKEFLDSMQEYLKRTENFVPLTESYECLTLEILKKMPSILPSGKRTTSTSKLVLQIFEENTTVATTIPCKTDPPRLICIGDVTKDIILFSYIDGYAIFSERCPIRAVLLLVATYWVFNIEFVPESRPSFLLISSVILGEELAPKTHISKCSSVNCLLKQLNL